MKTISFIHFNRPFIYGLALMTLPTLFWIGVFFEQILNNPFITDGIFLKLDQLSHVFSIIIMMVMPLSAAVINLNFVWKQSLPTRSVSFDLFGNVLVFCYAVCTMVMILGYLFTENVLGKGM